jgi:hypothetical protein
MIFTEDICPAVESHVLSHIFKGNPQCFVDDIQTPHTNGLDLRQTKHGVFADCFIPRNTFMGFYGGDIIPLSLLRSLQQIYRTGVVLHNEFMDENQLAIYPVQHYRGNYLVFSRIELHQNTSIGRI